MASAQHDAATRILVVAADLQIARRLVDLVTSVSATASTDPASTQATLSEESSSIIPWTISNKYYDAEVHFAIQSILEKESTVDAESISSADKDEGAPAIIYAFEPGTAYRPRFLDFIGSRSARVDDAEVCIAAALPAQTTSTIVAPKIENMEDGDEDLDDFFAQHSFEFVNTLSNSIDHVTSPPTDDDHLSHELSGVNRIRDALFSIMWPNLVRKKPSARAVATGKIPVVFKDGSDAVDGAEGISLHVDDITDDVAQSLFTTADGAIDGRELAALEAWLDADGDADAWRPSKPGEEVSPDPDRAINRIVDLIVPERRSGATASRDGFDDDFTEFVSSPASNAQSPTQADVQQTVETLSTLLPSQAEISAASSRIFKPVSTPPPEPDEDIGGLSGFDLTQVLGALQAMKEEISLIDDVDKRRKAAAAAALGLVAGLGLDAGGDDEDGSELGDLLAVE